jgi:NAD(P)H-flavin reductase
MFAESASPVGPCFFGFSEEIAPALRERLARVGSVVIDPPGKPGEALRALDSLLRESPGLFDDAHVYVCGPAAMMNAAVRLLHGIIPESRILLSREDVMRCGIGVCGSCGTPSGLRSCVDGPALNPGM